MITFSTAISQSTPSPLRGGIKGGGREPGYLGPEHPLPTSPVEGEVPSGERGGIEFQCVFDTNSGEQSHG